MKIIDIMQLPIRLTWFLLGFPFLLISSFVLSQQPSLQPVCDFFNNTTADSTIKCGTIEVNEDHNNNHSPKIKIAYAILKKRNANSTAYPVIYLSGGPGSETLRSMTIWANNPLRQEKDIILLDHRGIGFSSPLPNIGPSIMDIIFSNANLQQEEALMNETMKRFKDSTSLTEKKLGLYNIHQISDDIGVLMDKLGYSKYDLYGVSYGTRLGIILMNKFPSRINSAILYGVAPPSIDVLATRAVNLSESFQNIFAQCANDTTCHNLSPQLEKDFEKALAMLQTNPIIASLRGKTFVINPQDAIHLLRYQMYSADALTRTASLIKAFLNRDTAFINKTQQFFYAVYTTSNLTMNYSCEIYDNYTSKTVPDLERYLSKAKNNQIQIASTFSLARNASHWHKEKANNDEKNIKPINIPVLLLTNRFDPACPPWYAKEAKKLFSKAQLLIFDEYGHITRSDCKEKLFINFFANPEKVMSVDCIKIFEKLL